MKDASIETSLHILCLEDDLGDRQLMELELVADGLNCKFLHVQSQAAFEAALQQNKFDLILSDFSLPSYNGEAALTAAKQNQPETPFILLTGTIGEERAVEILKSGATDCVLKNKLGRLGMAVRRALSEAEERDRRKRAEEGLRTQAERLRALAASLQAGREEERIRISREIHDEFGEALTAQKFGLGWIREHLSPRDQTVPWEQVFDKINSLGALVDGTANRVRRLCTELRPSILDDLGLTAAIEWQAREFQTRTNIRCKIVESIGELDVGGRQATALFRIFQEILTNVARHSSASKVDVTLKITGQNLVLRVKDNGKGINEDKLATSSGSLGILGMRERASLLGGELMIRGTPAKGTTVTVSIPLDPPAPNPAGWAITEA